jgi:hypothetical protein
MARSTRNRRSTKHRGNAAGMIETRGRTGRKPTASEKGSSSGSRGGRAGGSRTGSSRRNRYDKPPTWKGSAIRGGIAAVLVYGVIALLNRHQSAVSELLLVPIVLAVYIPLIHYTDSYMYRRQQRRKAQGGGR